MLKTLLAAAAVIAMATGAARADVVVASKIDTEGSLLGSMIRLVLQENGIPVVDRVSLGATPVVRAAIKAGEIDIYPEYTGNAGFFYNMADSDVWKDAVRGYAEARKRDYEAEKIVWLTPAPANNTWAIAVRGNLAAAENLRTMSDFGAYVSRGGKVKLAASAEFVNSAAALPAFQKAYGFTLRSDQLLTLAGGDTAATIKAAAEETDGTNAAMVYGTDGAIAEVGLVVMADDKGVQPVYQPTPIIREAVLKQYPQIEKLLEPVFSSLDLETLQKLNARIAVGGENATAVARDYLTSKGLLK